MIQYCCSENIKYYNASTEKLEKKPNKFPMDFADLLKVNYFGL